MRHQPADFLRRIELSGALTLPLGEFPQQVFIGAAEEIRNYKAYDYVLINRELPESDAVLSAIVRAERVRRTRIEDQIRPILDTFQE